MWKRLYSSARTKVENYLLQTETSYRLYLRLKYSVDKPLGSPNAPWSNKVLRKREEWVNAVKQVESLNLPLCSDLPKNWDSLSAVDCILKRGDRTAYILDAGAELYSMVLPWLYLYGYRNLIGVNLSFKSRMRRGPIRYEYGDITQNSFKENTFDAITCLSVIEHGVDLSSYFKEMSRILKPNGILITSTDYYETPIDTKGQEAYGAPIHIFSKQEILSALDVAKKFDLELTGPLDLSCEERTICWNRFKLSFTFLIFTLQKKG